MSKQRTLLEVYNIKKYFPINRGLLNRNTTYVKAVDDISFKVIEGETLGLVGESGCGKSTLGRSILRLIEPTSGKVIFDGKDISTLSKSQMRAIRQDMQIIFQDPYASLNPRMTVGDFVGEPLDIFRIASGEEKFKKVILLLEKVGLDESCYNRYPHEFSGGQRQRIVIARALSLNPKFIICDEPVSALDVSVRSQVLNLMQDLQKEFNLTYLFISHDLSVVKHISDRVAVMYLGRIVEITGKDELYKNAMHPYTKALLSAIKIPDPALRTKAPIVKGDIPSPTSPPNGCHFHPRCPQAQKVCSEIKPELAEVTNEHFVACHLYNENAIH